MLGCGKDNICPKGESRSKLQNFVYPANLLYILNSDSKEGDLKVGEDSQRLLMGVGEFLRENLIWLTSLYYLWPSRVLTLEMFWFSTSFSRASGVGDML